MNRYQIEKHTIKAADAIAFHVIRVKDGKEIGRFLFEEAARKYLERLERYGT